MSSTHRYLRSIRVSFALLLAFLVSSIFPLQQQQRIGIEEQIPSLTLPWGTWQGQEYDARGDIYKFTNVRFGQAPLGSLRFDHPRFPDAIPDDTTLQNSTYGPNCIATHHAFDSGDDSFSEDCLFLDLYVPKTAFSSSAEPLAVVVWIYGGDFAGGSKNLTFTDGMLYSGTGPIRSAITNGEPGIIFVVGNYRLGAFGWLAGPYMEKVGVPNAGLFDQRLLLKWVQCFIHLVNGDKARVSIWGESAGASSILHHMVLQNPSANGSLDPLFRRAVLQGPAFQWLWDRSEGGALDYTYGKFARLAGCGKRDISCLRAQDSNTLQRANQRLYFMYADKGILPVGPAIDGKWIPDLPSKLLKAGKFWRDMDSIVVSHTLHESESSTPIIETWDQYTAVIATLFPKKTVQSAIQNSTLYSAKSNLTERLLDIIRDAFFTSNIRQIFDAYQTSGTCKIYAMQYSFPGPLFPSLSRHGYDILPTFWNTDVNISEIIERMKIDISPPALKMVNEIFPDFASRYQAYLVSNAIYGDPNCMSNITSGKARWDVAKTADDGDDFLTNVLNTELNLWRPDQFFDSVTDIVTSKARSDFWLEMALELTRGCSDEKNLEREKNIKL